MSQTNPVIGIWKLFQIKTKGEFKVQQLFPTKAYKVRIKTFYRKQEVDPFLYYKPMSFPPNEGKACYCLC